MTRMPAISFLLCVVSTTWCQTPRMGLDSLGWLAGCWEARTGTRVVSEQWMKPLGTTMLGMSRTVAGDRTVEYEYCRLERAEDGLIRFVALPSGQAGGSFTLVRSGPGLAVFENPEHDFPQRILYRLIRPDSLHARIEGVIQGKPRGVDFPYRRVPCE